MFQQTADGTFVQTSKSMLDAAVRRERERAQKEYRIFLLAGPAATVFLFSLRNKGRKLGIAQNERGDLGLTPLTGSVRSFDEGGARGDFRELRKTYDDQDDCERDLNSLLREAHWRVVKNWDAIAAVATELQQQRFLTGKEVRSVIRRQDAATIHAHRKPDRCG